MTVVTTEFQVIQTDLCENLAVTYDGEKVETWGATKSKSSRFHVFMDKRGNKKLLYSDDGRSFKGEAKEAENCFYKMWWFGDFPYGSWAWAIRICKITKTCKISTFTTEINPRGQTDLDKWIDDCITYAP